MRKERIRYAVIALFLLAVEVLIAMKLSHLHFVRGSLGDVLVVVFLYALALSIRDFDRPRLAAAIFLFACFIELCQYFRLAQALGLHPKGILGTVIGSTATWEDIVCYLVGTAVALSGDLATWRIRAEPGGTVARVA